MSTIPAQLDAAHRRCILGAEPMIFHCHHYNTFLQRSILDAKDVESVPFLVGAAAEVSHGQLRALFLELRLADVAGRRRLAAEVYRWAGFGTFDLSGLDEAGGEVSTTSSHYAMAWPLKFGKAASGVCHFAAGWLAGALAAIYDKPNGTYSVTQTRCAAVQGAACSFKVTAGPPGYTVFQPVGLGPLTVHAPRPIPASPVDYEGIFAALTGMEIVGDEDGQIPAFGVHLTRHYANYYNRISFELERAMARLYGREGRDAAAALFVEAGHVCAFNTFGGMMTSSEWDALIRPTLRSKEDWVHGMVAAVNALGWGRWQVTLVSEAEAEFVLHDDYESVGHLAMYGPADHPVSYLAQGAVVGLMNLVYLADIASRPVLDAAFYQSTFKRVGGYHARCVASQAMGDPVTVFRVSRSAEK